MSATGQPYVPEQFNFPGAQDGFAPVTSGSLPAAATTLVQPPEAAAGAYARASTEQTREDDLQINQLLIDTEPKFHIEDPKWQLAIVTAVFGAGLAWLGAGLRGQLEQPGRYLDPSQVSPAELVGMAASLVLVGEATHGTHEFYRIRADLTRALIQRRGFSAVAV